MTVPEIVRKLKKQRNQANIDGMIRFGIKPKIEPMGITMPVLRTLSKEIKHTHPQPQERHQLALELWKTGFYEARLIAAFIEDPKLVTEKQMESWVADFDNWAICDTVCGAVFDKHPLAYQKALEWTKRPEPARNASQSDAGGEYIKRAGFVLMAWMSVHNKNLKDSEFYPFLKAIKREATDERNYVRKAVNWALRQIGKSRNQVLNKLAIKYAQEIYQLDNKTAKWIASDALRELKSPAIQKRFR